LGYLHGTNGEPAGELQVPVTCDWKEGDAKEIHGNGSDRRVIKQVEEMAVKDGAIKGINFKERKGLEYEFDNGEEYEMLVEPDEPVPFPDIPADAPGMLTKLEEEYGINDVVQDKSEMSDEQRAVLATNNSGLDFLSVPTKVTGGGVIEILNDDEEDMLNEYKRDEALVKIEPDQTVGATAELESGKRRSGQIKIANRQFKDCELYHRGRRRTADACNGGEGNSSR
jgi:hypothetical protein